LPSSGSRGEIVRLMTDSTIWPGLLLLRLKSEDQRVTIVNILPDSIHGDGFRALSVACRWIAAHKNSTEDKNF
jgi:toxin CptA